MTQKALNKILKEEFMKRIFKKVLCTVFAMALVVALGIGMVACNKEAEPIIAVVAKGETHAFWQSVKSGAEAAGEKYGYRITFRGPTAESEQYVPEQREFVTQALNNKNTKALVLATIGTGFTDELVSAYDKGIPVVEFDSGLYNNGADITAGKDPTVSAVASDNYAAAGVAAQNFYDNQKEKIEAATTADPYVVCIIQHDSSQTGIDRANGFKDKIDELAKAQIEAGTFESYIEVKTNNAGEYKAALQASQTRAKPADAVFMCNEGVVNECYPEVTDNVSKYANIIFCGFDAGTNQIDWIKGKVSGAGKLIGSVAQDSFQIGYQAVEQAAFAIEGKTVTEKVGIKGTWYDSTNIDEMIENNIVYEG